MNAKGKLQVQCQNCSKWFNSPIQMDEPSFATSTIENNKTQCPYCGQITTFGKGNMRFAKE